MKNNTIKIFLIVLFFNIIISYIVGYRYKDFLTTYLSPAIYYQSVVFISLTLPIIISWLYNAITKKIIIWRLKKFQKKAININREILDENTKSMLEEITSQDIPTNQEIKDLYKLMNDSFK